MSRLTFACLSLIVVVAASSARAAGPDPYAALQLYDGAWSVTTDGQAGTTNLVNHCARTGLFFACEQVINGKTGALVVFKPIERRADGQAYMIEALRADGHAPGPWSLLIIDGDRWVYPDDFMEHDQRVYTRTVNVFTGRDRIHFEIQRSTDQKSWTTQMSGDERRVR